MMVDREVGLLNGVSTDEYFAFRGIVRPKPCHTMDYECLGTPHIRVQLA